MNRALTALEQELDRLESQSLLREVDEGRAREAAERAAEECGEEFLDASSNDYLGFASDLVSRETLFRGGELGAGASRLIHGTRREHLELERAFADWVHQPSALLFASGYAANVGLLSAIALPGTLIVSDRLNHASLVDGCRLGRAKVEIVPHLDLSAVERALGADGDRAARWVVVESYYSMDGDSPDLARLQGLCEAHGAGLIVDEAHALGIFGPQGAGLCRAAGIVPTVTVGPLGKGFGGAGAFVAGPPVLRRWLWNRARSFVFSTGTSPLFAGLALERLRQVQGADDRRAALDRVVTRVRATFEARGLPVLRGSHGPILPLLVGSEAKALRFSQRINARGVLAQAIRPPSVPREGSRVRLTLTAKLSDSAVNRLIAVVTEAWEEVQCFT